MTRTEFIDLLDAYWNAAYHEGEAAATTDTPDGRAGKINSALMREYDALAPRLAEAEALLRHVADTCSCARVDIDAIAAFLAPADSAPAATEVQWKPGDFPAIRHIEYCPECHYSRDWIRAHGHGEGCPHRAADQPSDAG